MMSLFTDNMHKRRSRCTLTVILVHGAVTRGVTRLSASIASDITNIDVVRAEAITVAFLTAIQALFFGVKFLQKMKG